MLLTYRMDPNKYNRFEWEWTWEKWQWSGVFTLSRTLNIDIVTKYETKDYDMKM